MKPREKTSEEILREHGLEPDPVIEAYKKDVDRTMLIENLKLTPNERSKKFESFMIFLEETRGAARKPAR